MNEQDYAQEGYIPYYTNRKLEYYDEGTYVDPARGGVLILVKSILNPSPVDIEINAEVKWIKINPHEKIEILVGVAYHPDLGGLSNLEVICESMNCIDTENVLLMGDFNLRDIDWRSMEATANTSKLFLQTLEDNCLYQLVNEPTRGSNLIDLVITGNPDMIDNVSVEQPFSTSDHRRTDVTLKVQVPRIEAAPRKIYLYSKGDYTSFNKEVRDSKWETVLGKKTVNHQWDIFKTEYHRLREKYIPHKLIKANRRLKPPWTRYKSVKKAQEAKRKAYVKSKISGLNADSELYKQESRRCTQKINEAKAHYENTLVEDIPNNPKRFYNYARSFTRTSSTIDCLETDGRRVTDDVEKANILNDYFASVMTEENFNSFQPPLPEPIQNGIHNITFTPNEVREKLKHLKKHKASGMDEVHVNVLMQVLDFDVPLSIIFNTSLRTGTIPQDWRDANITPLYKKGSRMNPNNYRPVSLTSQVCKVMERLILDILWKHINKEKLISCQQHGFQKNCSCVTQLLECMHDWLECIDEGGGVDAVYLDFAKAFDTVPHTRLLRKLHNMGIRGAIHSWIASFLSHRRQRVILRNGTSRWSQVTSGVPQGSILGPVLFLLYVNDLPDTVMATAKMFADDTKVYKHVKNRDDCQELQEDLNRLSAWSKQWLLKFNASKCVALRIKNSIQYVYTLNGTYLRDVDSQNDLGVTITNDLMPSRHILNIAKKANTRIYMIKRCFTGLTKKKLLILYKSIVRPIMEYASPVWSPWQVKDKEILQKTQDRCLRLCSENIELESLEERRKKTDLVETYKFKRGFYKTPSKTFFKDSETTHLRGHSQKIFKTRSRLEVARNFFSQRVVDPWNSLDEATVSAENPKSFKTRMKSCASND